MAPKSENESNLSGEICSINSGEEDRDRKAARLNELRSSFLSVLLDHQKPIKDGDSYMSSDELDSYRMIGDGPLDLILNLLRQEGTKLGPTDDFLRLAEKATNSSSKTPSQIEMCSFLETYQAIPSWVDKEQLKRGQEVFLAYSPAAGLALYYRSLVPGFSSPMINAVVQATAYLTPPARPDQSLNRILDTAELLSACIGLGIDSILPGGIGWRTAIHVRVLHGKVRYALLQRKGKRKWDMAKYGTPINQEDMAATLLAFSVNVITGIDLVSGLTLSDKEKLDYLALWRYIGWLLGVETSADTRLDGQPSTSDLPPLDPCGPPTNDTHNNAIQKSYSLLQSMVNHLGDPDKTSIKIAHHLLQITDRIPSKDLKDKTKFYQNGLFYYRSLQCRKFIGEPLADALQLPLHPIFWKRQAIFMVSSMAWFTFRIYTRAAMYSSFCRKLMLRFHGRNMVIFHNHWNDIHKTKMAKLAKARQKMFNLVSLGGVKDKEDEKITTVNESICPFAMIAEPIN
jgi:hypothetical protein